MIVITKAGKKVYDTGGKRYLVSVKVWKQLEEGVNFRAIKVVKDIGRVYVTKLLKVGTDDFEENFEKIYNSRLGKLILTGKEDLAELL